MSNSPSKAISQLLIVMPLLDGGLPRESALGRQLFERYLAILDGPMETSDQRLKQLARLLTAVNPRVEGRLRRRRLRLRKRDRKVMRSLSNWREHDGSRSWESDPTSQSGRAAASSQELAAEGNSRHKRRELEILSLGNTSYDSTTRLRYWFRSDPGQAPTYVATKLEDWIDYSVGPGRPFRPVTGVNGNGRVPTTCGVLPVLKIGYGPLTGPWPAQYGYYEGLPQPQVFSQYGAFFIDRPSSEEQMAPSTTDVNLARLDAEASMYAGTPKSRPNFLRALIELKDSRATARGLADFYQWGSRFLRSMTNRKVWSSLGKGWKAYTVTGRETIAATSSAYLNAQFGILPTMSDVKTFLSHLRNGLSVFGEDKGRSLQKEGAVVTSHYTVVPRALRSRLGKTYHVATAGPLEHQVRIRNGSDARNEHTNQIQMSVGRLTSAARKYPTIAATVVRGTVFARMKPTDELSEYMKAKFGHVGYTWSYPGITTAWELLPWSWLVDWFADVRRKVRVAERLARSYWMRVAFQEPWYFEKSNVQRYYPEFKHQCCALSGPQRARNYGGSSGILLRYYSTHRFTCSYSGAYPSASTFSRGPLKDRPSVPPTQVRARINVFRISIGMALLAQSASSGR